MYCLDRVFPALAKTAVLDGNFEFCPDKFVCFESDYNVGQAFGMPKVSNAAFCMTPVGLFRNCRADAIDKVMSENHVGSSLFQSIKFERWSLSLALSELHRACLSNSIVGRPGCMAKAFLWNGSDT